MDSLFHFIFPIIAALAARVHIKHGIKTVLGLAFLTVLMDIDHYFGFIPRGSFHNIFLTLIIPLLLIVWSFRSGTEYQRQVSILLLLFLFSHTMLDMFTEGGVSLLYPITDQRYSIDFGIYTPEGFGLMTSQGIGLLIYSGMLSLAFFLEQIDQEMLKRKERFGKAMKKVLRRDIKQLN